MADKDQPNKADKAGGKAPTGTRKAPETKSRTQTKRAAPARRTPRQAKATPQEAKGATGSPSAEADSIAWEASERAERLKRTGFSEALSESARRVAARSNADMTEGVNAMERATVMTKLGREVARIGAKEVLEGAQVLMASEEIAAESLAVEALSGDRRGCG